MYIIIDNAFFLMVVQEIHDQRIERWLDLVDVHLKPLREPCPQHQASGGEIEGASDDEETRHMDAHGGVGRWGELWRGGRGCLYLPSPDHPQGGMELKSSSHRKRIGGPTSSGS